MAPLLRRAKHLAFEAAQAARLNTIIGSSMVRRHRLLILCYHGVSLVDEHEWDPELHVTQDHLRRRLTLLRETGCSVLPLGEALERCATGTLPERAVALTFDDGFADFAVRALPVLRELDMRATVYLTTYYCGRQIPIPDLALPYLLWQASKRALDLSAFVAELGIDVTKASAAEKHALVERVADASGFGYETLVRTRLFQIMSREEVAALPAELVDVELHTHRHQPPDDASRFLSDLAENREHIVRLRGRVPAHLCYPSGCYRRDLLPSLRQHGIRSATTCIPGYMTAATDGLLIPRFVDTMVTPEPVFRGWLSGVAALLPHRAVRHDAYDDRRA
ncbi:MAG: polysaccharide deacetylase family protein [Gemmatimonadaceae bacterium]